jgi:hypothetical protein
LDVDDLDAGGLDFVSSDGLSSGFDFGSAQFDFVCSAFGSMSFGALSLYVMTSQKYPNPIPSAYTDSVPHSKFSKACLFCSFEGP